MADKRSVKEIFINLLMKEGKKERAFLIFYKTLVFIKKKKKVNPINFLEDSLENVKPLVGLKLVKKRRKKFLVPFLLSERAKNIISVRWVIESGKTRRKKGFSLSESLADELIDSKEGKGLSIKKKEDLYEKVLENSSFLRFWF